MLSQHGESPQQRRLNTYHEWQKIQYNNYYTSAEQSKVRTYIGVAAMGADKPGFRTGTRTPSTTLDLLL